MPALFLALAARDRFKASWLVRQKGNAHVSQLEEMRKHSKRIELVNDCT